MSWVLALLLAAVAFVVMAFVLKAPRKGWEAMGAALLLGIAGYGLQGSPALRGSPKQAVERGSATAGEGSVEARNTLCGPAAGAGAGGNSWLVIADAMSRHGAYSDAASVLLGATEKQPKDFASWLALGNALVDHSEGTVSPAALYAYRRAEALAPGHPCVPLFLGLAFARSGRLADAQSLWADLLKRSAPDAPWRPQLEAWLGQANAMIARQQNARQ